MNVIKILSNISNRAYKNYRFYLYWMSQERMASKYSPDYIKDMQWRKFRELLDFAYNKIPFYNDKFTKANITPEDIKDREDLIRIPILTKDEIRRNFPDKILDNSRNFRPSMMGRTSGSTGESLHFVKPDETWNRSLYYSILLRTRRIRNIPVLVLTTPRCTPNSCSLHDENSSEEIIASKFQKIWFLRHLDGSIGLPSSQNILSASDEYMARLERIISHFSPCIMIADPVYLGAFARYLRRNGKTAPKFKVIITTFELLTDSLRDLLSEVFNCEIFTQYGTSEINDIANECEYHKLHVRASNILVEAIHDGKPAERGEIGNAVITDLCNYNMPFIRYDIGDIITLGDNKCQCGRNTDTIESIQGRASDIIKSGTRSFTALQIDQIFRGFKSIAAYRFVQEAKDSYKISIMADRYPGIINENLILNRCRSMFGDEDHFEIEFVEKIMPQVSKKFRFVYSDMTAQKSRKSFSDVPFLYPFREA